jgi:hypothetical protein
MAEPPILAGRFRKSVSSVLGFGVALGLGLLSSPQAAAWGPTGHHLVEQWAVGTLPPELRGFFEANRSFLIDHANDPDSLIAKDHFERSKHYIYFDEYGTFPYLKLPHSFERAVHQYGSGRINRNGVLPWQIGKMSLKLTEAMKARNWDEVRTDAAVLGHYVADAHDPLHTTGNYDGQLSGQPGLASRFEIQLVDRFKNFFIFAPGDANKIEDPTEYAFQISLEADTWVDQIILADRRSLDGLPAYNDDYFDRFYSQVGSVVMRQLNDAAHDTGSYWYTAWLNAGQPPLPPR